MAKTRIRGPERPDTLGTLQNLGGTLDAQGDLVGAQALYEHALEAKTGILGTAHTDTTLTRFIILLTLLNLGDRRAAAPLVAILGALRQRAPATRSVVEMQILQVLPKMEALLRQS